MPDKPTKTWKVYLGTLLLAVTLTLSGCSARAGAGETAVIAPLTDQLGGAPLLADLPALVITYSDAGEPSIGSAPLGDLQALVPATLLSQLTVDQATIDRLVNAGIQHVQISNTPSGLRILVNGQPLPTLVWDAKSLDALLQILEPIEPSAVAALGNLLDTTTNIGVGVVVELPVPAGAAAIPLIVTGEGSNAAAAEAAQQAFVARAGGTPVVQIPVRYADDGTWTVQGLTDTEWQALTGLPFGYVRLNPELIAGAVSAGINQVIVWTDRDGIHVTLGERELPYLRWGDGGIQTLLDLALRLGVMQENEVAPDTLKLLVDQWLPALQSTELRIVVDFPGG
jgi:hypothetical protein